MRNIWQSELYFSLQDVASKCFEVKWCDWILIRGLQKPICEFDPKFRDEPRIVYLFMGPCQPHGHAFPHKLQWGHMRGFTKTWFDIFGMARI